MHAGLGWDAGPKSKQNVKKRDSCGSACCGLVCRSPCGSPMWGGKFGHGLLEKALNQTLQHCKNTVTGAKRDAIKYAMGNASRSDAENGSLSPEVTKRLHACRTKLPPRKF